MPEPILSHQTGEPESLNHTEIMPPAEVLARASAFDPTPTRNERIMRLALEMIVNQSGSDPWALAALNQATAERALRECA